jgi:hypothetical protein
MKINSLLITIWILGALPIVFRAWYLQIQLLKNLAPGETRSRVVLGYVWNKWDLFLNPVRVNPTGEEFQRKLKRLYWIGGAYGAMSPLFLGMVGWLFF